MLRSNFPFEYLFPAFDQMQITSQNTAHTLFTENNIFQKVKSISQYQNEYKTILKPEEFTSKH